MAACRKECIRCGEVFYPKNNAQKSCPPCAEDKRSWEVWRLDYTRRLRRLAQMAKNRARSKGLDYNIDGDYLISLWNETDGCCALTGRQLRLEAWGSKGQVHPDAPSVDRINPKKGYVKGNVRLITYHLNVALSEYGTDIFESLVKSYMEFN